MHYEQIKHGSGRSVSNKGYTYQPVAINDQ